MLLNPETPLHFIDGPVPIRLGAAAWLGLLLGLDRELRGHPAGIHSHDIICFTAALMMISAIALHNQLRGQGNPPRVFEASAAFTGIIAAGLIMFNMGKTRNLTTAAHIWLAGVIGIACGAALWPLVVSAATVAVNRLTMVQAGEDRWRDPENRKR